MAAALIPGLPDEMARECLTRVPFSRFHTVRAVSKLWLDEVESPDFHRLRKTNGLTHTLVAMAQSEPVSLPSSPGRKYTCSPIYRPVIFDPESSSWCALPLPPGLSSDGLPLFCQLAGLTRELVVIGGCDPDTWAASDEVFIFDFLTAKWRTGAKMPGPRRSFFACAASVRDRMVFVAGGHDEMKTALKSAMAYDVAQDKWVPMPDMAQERDECKGLFQGGMFHAVGGYGTNKEGQFGKCSEAFDVDAWKWGPVVDDTLESSTCPSTCVAGHGRKLYRCRSGKLAAEAEEGGGKAWRDVAEIPMDARVAPNLVAWREEVVMIGSGWHDGPHVAYRTGKGKAFEWTKLKVPEEYSGQVQALCCLEV